MIDKKELNKYLKEIRKYLICTYKEKRQIIKIVKTAVLTFADENNIQDIDGIYINFGTPKAVAKQYLPQTDFKEIKRRLIFRRALITVFAFIISLFTIYISAVVYKHITTKKHMVYISPAVVITTDENESVQERISNEQL